MIVMEKSRHPAMGILAIALIYFYFLQFSQFTFLHLLDEALTGASRVKAILALMAIGGIAGSGGGVVLRLYRASWQAYVPGFLICGLVAVAAPHAGGWWTFALLAGFMGLALGMLTVTTAGLLPLLLPERHRGLAVGLGTGLAYAASNLPVLFNAPAQTRSIACGLILLASTPLYAAWWLWRPRLEAVDIPIAPARAARRGRWHWIVMAFLLLVWLDSALFYIIQENRSLRELSWGAEPFLWPIAAVHLLGALLAGWFLDRGWRLQLFPLAWLALAAGAAGLQWLGREAFILAYVAGVSLYSTLLVYLPSSDARQPAGPSSFLRAATVYVVAGWIGSGLGIGMAENLSRIPAAFIAVSGILLLPVVKFSWQKR